VVADQWLAAGDPRDRFVFLGSTLLGKDGLPEHEWDVIRIDFCGRDEWTLTATECAIRRTAQKDDEAREKLELLRTRLEDRFIDLTVYRTLLATVRDGRVKYKDAARGFSPA
jgi:hypothetical protein